MMAITDITGFLMPLSYALQIVGATFLLLGSRKKYQELKAKQKSEAEDDELLNFPIQCSGVVIGTDYTIPAQSEYSKMMSFCEISIGYALAIISTTCPLSRCSQVVIVVVASLALFMINKLVLYIVKKEFEKLYKKKPKFVDA